MTNLSESKVRSFQKKILFWYEKNKRELPWRELLFDVTLQQRDPYKILVSEVMAQQTQIARVIPKYHAWLTRFPTLQSLAEAPTREVLLYWSGLGYNRRALNLQKAAQVIVREYQGEFPRSVETLRKLPGIGQYTASAIACFAFNEQIAVIDTNVRKVILIEILKKEKAEEKEIEAIARQVLPKGMAYDWNQALMDYAGATLKDKKIIVPRQAAFKTSNRYYRGQILKILVRQHTATTQELWDYFSVQNPIEKQRLDTIFAQLIKEGILQREGDKISIR